MSEFQLYADIFTKADQEELVGFSCGDSTQGKFCTQWILGSDVFDSMKRGTTVWLFRNQEGKVVGYGSLGIVRWRWPLSDPEGKYTKNLYIPMLGIDKNFQGQPTDTEWRFSHQIMNHLIAAAYEINQQLDNPLDWVLLMVAPDNTGAIKLYEHFDFELIPNVTRGPGLRVMQRLMTGE